MPHQRVLKYLLEYARHFRLDGYIKFNSKVVNIKKLDDGKWQVEYYDKSPQSNSERAQVMLFDAILVCTGIHSVPRFPKYRGEDTFRGTILHSHAYKDFVQFTGKSVVIVGSGNSAADIATEVSYHAKTVFLSMRGGCWVLGKFIKSGRPLDHLFTQFSATCLPPFLFCHALKKAALFLSGNTYRLGYEPLRFTVCSELPLTVAAGFVLLKPEIAQIKETSVIFNDQSEQCVDAIIFATGYEIDFSIIESYKGCDHNNIPLYKAMIDPNQRNLFFIGAANTIGALFPVMELQSRFATQIISHNVQLPPIADMVADIRLKEQIRVKRLQLTNRISTETDALPYMNELADLIHVRPTPWRLIKLFVIDPQLSLLCFFGPAYPFQFRLFGDGKWDGARSAIIDAEQWYRHHLNLSSLGLRSYCCVGALLSALTIKLIINKMMQTRGL